MTITFKDVKHKSGYLFATPPFLDSYKLDHLGQVRILIAYLGLNPGLTWPLWTPLFRESLDLTDVSNHPSYPLYLAVKSPAPALLTYLNGLTDAELKLLLRHFGNLELCYATAGLASLEPLLCLSPDEGLLETLNVIARWAIITNKEDVIIRLLQIPFIVRSVLSNANNQLLQLSAQQGHLSIMNRLLEIPAVLGQITADNNKALTLGAKTHHLAVTNRLLEFAQVRQGKLYLPPIYYIINTPILGLIAKIPFMLAPAIYYDNATGLHADRYTVQGLKRALWLSLQEAPGFSELTSLEQLHSFAQTYLQDHPEWVNHDHPKELERRLANSMSAQVLAYAHNSPFIIMHKCASGTLTNSKSFTLTARLVDKISEYVGNPTEGLAHFSEPRFLGTQMLALRIFKNRYQAKQETSAVAQVRDTCRVM